MTNGTISSNNSQRMSLNINPMNELDDSCVNNETNDGYHQVKYLYEARPRYMTIHYLAAFAHYTYTVTMHIRSHKTSNRATNNTVLNCGQQFSKSCPSQKKFTFATTVWWRLATYWPLFSRPTDGYSLFNNRSLNSYSRTYLVPFLCSLYNSVFCRTVINWDLIFYFIENVMVLCMYQMALCLCIK